MVNQMVANQIAKQTSSLGLILRKCVYVAKCGMSSYFTGGKAVGDGTGYVDGNDRDLGRDAPTASSCC